MDQSPRFHEEDGRSCSGLLFAENLHKDATTFEIVAARLNLGSFQRYRKSTRHRHLAVRLQEGVTRAKCVTALPLDIKARLQAINSGAMQVALFGSEISYVGNQPIQGMRNAISRIFACPNRTRLSGQQIDTPSSRCPSGETIPWESYLADKSDMGSI